MDSVYALRHGLRLAAPGIGLFLAILLMAVPLRLGQGFVPTPLLPLIIVFLYSVYHPSGLPAPAVFGLGLFHDLLYGGALGIWASIYLLIQYLVWTQSDYLKGRLPRVIWIAFGMAMAICGFVYWLERSLVAGQFLPLWPLAYQFFITIAVYPVLSRLFFWLAARDRAAAFA